MGYPENMPKILDLEVRAVGVAIHDSLELKRQAEAKKKEQMPVKQAKGSSNNRVFEQTVMLQRLKVNG